MKVKTISSPAQSPSPRVGSATTALNGKIYLFSGRGGEAMAPIEENGCLWVLELSNTTWSRISPKTTAHNSNAKAQTHPQARSYHCMTNDGKDVIYIHAGCPEKGRLSDFWAFRVSTQEWTQLTSAPDPPRGGASMYAKLYPKASSISRLMVSNSTYANGRVFRMNGFDGQQELGGTLEIYDPSSNKWESRRFEPGQNGPGPRSVSTLLALKIDGDPSLITLFGESDPSSLGHQGAGKMLSDVWAYNISSGHWSQVKPQGGSPDPRGWFDADIVAIDGQDHVVVVGGLGESNERLDDVWMLSFS